MPKAVLQKGTIVPLEPLPADWEEGDLLEIARAHPTLDIEAWAISMNKICADSGDDDEALMRAAIDAHRHEAKEQTRREMGLSA